MRTTDYQMAAFTVVFMAILIAIVNNNQGWELLAATLQ